MPTARSTARRNIRPTRCRSSIRRPTRCRTSRCRSPIRSMPVSLGPGHAGAVKPTTPSAYWGDEILWDTKANQHNAMFDEQGPGLARRERARHGQSGLVQEGLGASVRQGVPARPLAAPGRDARSEDEEVQVHRHLLRHPSSAVRLRRRQHAVAVRHRPGGRLDQHQGVGRDRRRAEGGRLVPVRARHQRQRQARRVHRAGQAGGGQGHPLQSGLRSLRGDAASDRRLDLVHLRRVRRHGRASCASIRRPSSASSTRCRRKRSACAAATSARTACCGARARPAI